MWIRSAACEFGIWAVRRWELKMAPPVVSIRHRSSGPHPSIPQAPQESTYPHTSYPTQVASYSCLQSTAPQPAPINQRPHNLRTKKFTIWSSISWTHPPESWLSWNSARSANNGMTSPSSYGTPLVLCLAYYKRSSPSIHYSRLHP